MLVCGVVGAFVSVIGASIAGLPKSQWSLEPLVYLSFGFLAGFIGYPILLGLLRAVQRRMYPSGADESAALFFAMVSAVILAFLTGWAGYPISRYDAKKNAERCKAKSLASERRCLELYSILHADPDIVVREAWYKASDEKRDVYQHSISQKDTCYPSSTLSQLYALNPDSAYTLIHHPAFDPELLDKEFYRTLRSNFDCRRLKKFLNLPNAKEEWFVAVVAAGTLEKNSKECTDELRSIIARRRQNQLKNEQQSSFDPPPGAQ